ncbi:MAG: hypothetical protein ACU4F9_10390 [Arcticibacter sp.]
MIQQIKSILDENNIHYKIEDTIPSFDVTFSNNTSNIQYILKIEREDFKKAETLLNQGNIESSEDDHYLDSFTDDELIDVVLHPKEWHNSDIEYAKKLIKDRKIDLTENDIESYSKKNQILEELLEYAKNQIINENQNPSDVKNILLSKGLEEDIIDRMLIEIKEFKETNSKKSNNDLIFGFLWLAIGIGLTFANIGYIFWGAIVYGGYRLYKGLK